MYHEVNLKSSRFLVNLVVFGCLSRVFSFFRVATLLLSPLHSSRRVDCRSLGGGAQPHSLCVACEGEGYATVLLHTQVGNNFHRC